MRRQTAPGLDRNRLISAAFEILDSDGLEGLSMRRLAGHLGVQAPAIYWHVSDKAELLGAMARDIYAMAYAAVPSARDWREWLRLFGLALRNSFSSHRDGARLCAQAQPPSRTDPLAHADRIAGDLIGLGLDQRTALTFQAAVISYALGWAAFEANGPMHQFLDRLMAFDENYRIGLDAMVAGFTPPQESEQDSGGRQTPSASS